MTTAAYTEAPVERIEGESYSEFRKRQKARSMRIYRNNNKEKVLELERLRRKRNPEYFRDKARRLYNKDIEKTREKNRIRSRRYTEKQVEYNRKRRQEDPEIAKRTLEWNRQWRERNPSWRDKRTSRKDLYTPSWANLEKIKQIYEICRAYNQREDITFHVDHIIPAQGKNVCGLHVENNLQVITREQNLRKSNKLLEVA